MKRDLLIKNSSLVGTHEDAMFKQISAVTEDMAKLFSEYGCKLVISRKWSNTQDGMTSDKRLPITFGYECSSCFTASLVTKSFFRPKLVLNNDFSETLDELRFFLKALQEGKNQYKINEAK